MTPTINLRAGRWLVAAGLVFSGAVAEAQSGVTITQSQETSVKAGMSAADVERVLGRPARIVSYRNTPGPTWTYHVIGAPFGKTDFDVSFGGDGKVLWASEQIIGSTGPR